MGFSVLIYNKKIAAKTPHLAGRPILRDSCFRVGNPGQHPPPYFHPPSFLPREACGFPQSRPLWLRIRVLHLLQKPISIHLKTQRHHMDHAIDFLWYFTSPRGGRGGVEAFSNSSKTISDCRRRRRRRRSSSSNRSSSSSSCNIKSH